MNTTGTILSALCCLLAFGGLSAVAAQGTGSQDTGLPPLDLSLAQACLDNANLARQQGEPMDPEICIGLATGDCMEQPGGESTAGMANCALQERDYWDARLNRTYAEVMAKAVAADDELSSLGSAIPPQAPLLKQMQRDWIAFRDSACLWEQAQWQGGTGGIVASAGCVMTMTARQSLLLDRMLEHGE